MTPHITYSTKVLGNYCNSGSVYYDRPHDQQTLGSGNTFVIADHNQDMVLIQGYAGKDVISFTFPRTTLYDNVTHESVAVNKYGLGGSCVLINSDLHCYVAVQVARSNGASTELWHIVLSDVVLQ